MSNENNYFCKQSALHSPPSAYRRLTNSLYRYTPIGGQDRKKPLPYNPADSIKDQIQASFSTSLANLRTQYVDSYVLHSPLPTIEECVEAWQTLMSLQDAGKVRLIGISNVYQVDILEALSKQRKVQVVQNRWYQGNGWDREVLNYCQTNNIMYQ
jgi:diketogulonate reductase-like aldo/keto reductase